MFFGMIGLDFKTNDKYNMTANNCRSSVLIQIIIHLKTNKAKKTQNIKLNNNQAIATIIC